MGRFDNLIAVCLDDEDEEVFASPTSRKITTPEQLRTARHRLGLTQHALAEALRMGKSGWQSVSRWERDGQTIPGPVQVAVESLLRAL